MDDFMRRTEDGLKTLKEAASGIAFSVERQARIAGKKIEVMKVRRMVQKLCTEVGEYVYGEYAMERPLTMETPFIKERMVSICLMKSEMQAMEEEIEEIRRTGPPGRPDQTEEGEKKA
jgi:hypothetical protein